MTPRAPELPPDLPAMLGGPDAVPVVVAVSGGSDSVALALLMADASASGIIPRLHLAHLNHGIRGREAERDAQFVRRLAEELALPVTCSEVDVPALARERRISLEHAARDCRYEFLEHCATEAGARWVALGHTADDQLETILHNVLRGTGIHGLAGMPRSRAIAPKSGVRIVRPLIHYSRSELIDFLDRCGRDYRTDRTNLDTSYTRNRIRHQIVPVLEDAWPDIRSHITEFAGTLGQLDDLLEKCGRDWTDAHTKADDHSSAWEADLGEINALEEPVLSYVLRKLTALALGDLRRIDEVHVNMIVDLAATGPPGASLDLPRGLVVRRGYDLLRFEVGRRRPAEARGPGRPGPTTESPEPTSEIELNVPGESHWGGWRFSTEVLEGTSIWQELIDLSGCLVFPEFFAPPSDPRERMRVFIRRLREIDPEAVEYLDLDRIGRKTLTVRSRAPGDRFTPLGAPGQTKLKDFFIRRKVPRGERDSVPLIVAAGRVLVVAGLGIDDGAALTRETRRVLKIVSLRRGGGSAAARHLTTASEHRGKR